MIYQTIILVNQEIRKLFRSYSGSLFIKTCQHFVRNLIFSYNNEKFDLPWCEWKIRNSRGNKQTPIVQIVCLSISSDNCGSTVNFCFAILSYC